MIRYSARTDVGCRRQGNEDSLLADPDNGVFLVADGVGGRAAGEVASALTVQTFAERAPALRTAVDQYAAQPEWFTRNQVLEKLDEICQIASKRVFDHAESEDRSGMTTTLVVSVVGGGAVFLAHVGDSRAYLVRDGLIRQLTEDHSMVNELVRTGQMSWDEASTSRYRSVITRAIGLYPTVQADVMSIEILPGDRILLNSDGLSDPVPTKTIEEIAGQHAIDEVSDRLVQAAIDAGAPDNVTAIVVEPDASAQSEAARARAQVLDELFLFSDLPFHARLRVSRICEEQAHTPDQVLVKQGDPGDSMYVIVQGEVRVDCDGQELARFGVGEHFGELSLIDDQPRSATVIATSHGSSIAIRRQQLQDFCQRDPDLGNLIMWRLVATLGQRLRQTNRRTSRLADQIRQASELADVIEDRTKG